MARDFDDIAGIDKAMFDRGEFEETRESFAVRCLNAAASLYGVLTVDEFLALYNIYAKKHPSPISDSLGVEELKRIVSEATAKRETALEECDPMRFAAADETWFRIWTHPNTGERLVVYWSLYDTSDVRLHPDETPEEWRTSEVDFARARWISKELKVLSENAFLCYEDPMWAEESDDIDDLARIISGRDDIDSEDNMGIVDAFDVVADMRINGPSLARALSSASQCEIAGLSSDDYKRLVRVLKRIVPETRAWDYRGRTQRELVEEGMLPAIPKMKSVPYKEWQSWMSRDDEDGDRYDSEEDYEEDAWDTGHIDYIGDYIDITRLPAPKSPEEPFDFKKVKDAGWREKTLQDYQDIRHITADFVTKTVMKELSKKDRKAAMARLGFSPDDMAAPCGMNLDIVVGDFASMMDDQNGEPAIKRVLAREKGFVGWQRLAADYYAQYRYTWLEVTSVKAGFGVKCRDLLTGKDIFLMETSLSRDPNVKGMTVCMGIAPMGEVYIALGVMHPANFENPSTMLKVVLAHLGIPSDLPVVLSFADQASLAAETIRRIHALGRFGTIAYGAF